MTMAELKANKSLFREVLKLKEMPAMQAIMAVMGTQFMEFHKQTAARETADDKTLRLGQIEGYNMKHYQFMSIFELPPKPKKEPKATYTDPNL